MATEDAIGRDLLTRIFSEVVADHENLPDNRPAFAETIKLRCSFCGKHQGEVEKLIAGPWVFICNECVKLCQDILE